MPKSATDSIPDFLAHLAEEDKAFLNVNTKHIKTTYAMIEYIRNNLKNSMVKVNKEIKEGKILLGPTETKNEQENGEKTIT